MENWNPSVAFEIGYGMHEERVARATAPGSMTNLQPSTIRTRAAATLLAIARWLVNDPATLARPERLTGASR